MIKGAVAIFKRDFKKFLSNPFVIIMTLFMPIMYLIIFGNAMGGTITHVPIGVVQEDSPFGETPLFTAGVQALTHFQPQKTKPPLFDVRVFTDENNAKNELAEGRISAVVVFPSDVSNDHAVRLYVDSSDYMVPTLVQSGVLGSLNAIGSASPVQINNLYGTIEYLQFFGVGVIVMAMFMTTTRGTWSPPSSGRASSPASSGAPPYGGSWPDSSSSSSTS
jgi:ABC-2 type transport system permease protein